MADDKRAKGYSVNVMVQKKIVGTLTFLSKGVFVKMCKAGDGLLERILIAAPKPDLLPPTVHACTCNQVQQFIKQLEQTQWRELLHVFDNI